MPDQLAQQLARLAPEVDVPAGRDLFERSRAGGRDGRPGAPRWLLPAAVVVLVVAGLAGIWAVTGNDEPTIPAGPVDDAEDSAVTEGTVTEGSGYEVVHVAESSTAFGSAELVTTDDQYDAMMNPGPDVPPIDFSSNVALVMTRPDNACPDALTRFDIAPDASGTSVWTPVFEDLSTACDDPLLSWIYVVVIDRTVLGAAATIRIPADEVYDVPEQILPFESAAPPTSADEVADAITLTATGVTVPMPSVGEPAIHNTSAGLVWVVAHDDRSVSVLPAVIDQPVSEDEGGVTNLQSLVFGSASGRSFAGGSSGFVWDSSGRAVNGGRANDLVGYAGRVDGDEVEIMSSTGERVDGDIETGLAAELNAEEYPMPDLGEPIDLATFASLSSSGPIWRHLDATLVVENGVGRICELPPDPTFDQLTGCDESASEFVFDTGVTATDPGITSWFHAPILAFQDPDDGFTSVIPMGGMTSRNDAVSE